MRLLAERTFSVRHRACELPLNAMPIEPDVPGKSAHCNVLLKFAAL
ncbi:hypothetical protein [Niveibacterium umoris]|nr:hypothetical protein [Niveibacterium umoris]